MRVLTDEPDVDGVPAPLKDLVVKTLAKTQRSAPDAATSSNPSDGSGSRTPRYPRASRRRSPGFSTAPGSCPRRRSRSGSFPPRRRRWRDFGVAAAVTVVAAGLIATTAMVVSRRSVDGGGGAQDAVHGLTRPGAATQSPTPTGDRPTAAQGDSTGTASPAGTASASPRPTRTGRRVTMVRGYSFILPDDWMYYPDNTHNIEGMCLRPKDKRNYDTGTATSSACRFTLRVNGGSNSVRRSNGSASSFHCPRAMRRICDSLCRRR